MSYDVAQRSIGDIYLTTQNVDAVHGVYYLLLHVAFETFGTGLMVLRLPSVLAVAGAAWAVAVIGRELGQKRAGLVAAMALPALPAVQHYAQEGRSYALVCACVAWATYFLVRAISRPSWGAWLGYGAVMLVGCWLHEFAALALMAHGAALVGTRCSRAVLCSWAAMAAFTVAGVAPLVIVSMSQSSQVAWIRSLDWGDVAGLSAAAALGSICFFVAHRSAPTNTVWAFSLALMVLPPGALMAMSMFKDLYVDRYTLYSQVGVALVIGLTVDHVLKIHRFQWIAVASVIGFGFYTLFVVGPALRSPESRSDDVTLIANAVAEMSGEADGYVFVPSSRRAWMLYQMQSTPGMPDLALRSSPRSSNTLYGIELSPREVKENMLATHRLIVLRDPFLEKVESTPQDVAKRSVLRQYFHECGTHKVSKAHISVYSQGKC